MQIRGDVRVIVSVHDGDSLPGAVDAGSVERVEVVGLPDLLRRVHGGNGACLQLFQTQMGALAAAFGLLATREHGLLLPKRGQRQPWKLWIEGDTGPGESQEVIVREEDSGMQEENSKTRRAPRTGAPT